MWVRVSTPELKRNISMPVPLGLATTVVRLVPERVLAQGRETMPPELQDLLTKKTICRLIGECRNSLKQYKGLELVHVETADGEKVSITV